MGVAAMTWQQSYDSRPDTAIGRFGYAFNQARFSRSRIFDSNEILVRAKFEIHAVQVRLQRCERAPCPDGDDVICVECFERSVGAALHRRLKRESIEIPRQSHGRERIGSYGVVIR